MSILGGSFEPFLVFLYILVEPQHRDKIPQLRLITVYEIDAAAAAAAANHLRQHNMSALKVIFKIK